MTAPPPSGPRSGRPPLGRGLSALLGGDDPPAAAPRLRGAATVPTAYLRPSRVQPRRRFDEAEIDALAQSVRERGLLNPILVRPDPDREGRFEIVAGERRWRAAQRAQLHEVPVVVRDLADAAALEMALIENVQRQDLNPIEEASGYQRLIEEFAHTQDTIARITGKSRSHVANTLRLLALPDAVKDLVAAGRLTAGHARALAGEADADRLALWVAERGLSVRETEKLVERRRAGGGGRTARRRSSTAPTPVKDPDTAALEATLEEELGLKTTIDFDPDSGAGTITLAYRSLDQLDEVIRRLRFRPYPIRSHDG